MFDQLFTYSFLLMDKYKKYFCLILILSAVFSVLSVRNEFCWGDDFAQYILQAKSILSGNFEHFAFQNSIRSEYSTVCVGPTYYPWGFPLLIAPVLAIFGMNFTAFQIYISLFHILFLFSLWILFRNKLNRIQILGIIAIFAFNPFLFEFKKNLVPEIPFLLFSTLCIYLIERILIDKEYILKKDWLSYLLLGVILFVSVFLRTAGVTLVIVYFVAQVFIYLKTKKTHLVEWTPYIVLLTLYFIANSFFSSEVSSYKSVFAQAGGISVKSIFEHILYYSVIPSKFYEIPEFSSIIYGITLPFFFIGLINRFSKDFLYIIFVVIYTGLILLFPDYGGFRLLLPVAPFYFYFFFIGLESCPTYTLKIKGKPSNIPSGHIISYFIIIISFLAISYQSVLIQTGKAQPIQGPLSTDSKELFSYIVRNTKKDDKIIFWKPRAMILYTDRSSFFVQDVNRIITYKGAYLVEETDGEINVSQNLKFRNNSRLLFTNGHFKLYKLS